MSNGRPRIAFRCDGSKELGLGHVMRCLALAEALDGCEILFWVKEDGDILKILEGKDVTYIKYRETNENELAFIANELNRKNIDALIVDLLHYPPNYLKQLSEVGVTLIAFHELEVHDDFSDLVINYNSFRNFAQYHKKDEKRGCFGPPYAILRKGIRRHTAGNISQTVKTILITMGGSDPMGITLKAVSALQALLGNIQIIIHVGPAFKYRARLNELNNQIAGHFVIEENVTELAELMIKADIAVAAAGNTMYELCYLGVPAMVIAQNEHQYEFATELDRNGAIRSLGRASDVTEDMILRNVEDLCGNYEIRRHMTTIGRKMIDGRGLGRIKTKICNLIGLQS